MKRLIPFLFLIPPLHAQWVVVDPTNQVVNLATQANEVAHHAVILNQWAQELEKLNQQIRQAQDLIAVQSHIRDVMGNPAGAGASLLTGQLGSDALGRSFGDSLSAVRRLARAVDTLRNTVDDTFRALDDKTVLGRSFTRDPSFYTRFAVVEQQSATLNATEESTTAALARLQSDLAATIAALKAASTQAEVEKLSAVAAGLTGQIAHLDAVRREEAEKLRALQVLNENQAAKERTDLGEKQAADERDATAAVNAWQNSIRLKPTNYRP